MEAAADLPAPSVNAPTRAPSNATNVPTYASLSLIDDRGTTAATALLSAAAAMAAPVATSTAVADAPPPPTTTPMAMPTTSFVKLLKLNLQ